MPLGHPPPGSHPTTIQITTTHPNTRTPDIHPLALVTGAGRTGGIAASVVATLSTAGWDVAFTAWNPYDERMPWGEDPTTTESLTRHAQRIGARTLAIQADLADPAAPARIFDTKDSAVRATPLARLGQPQDCAHLIAFLCSPQDGFAA